MATQVYETETDTESSESEENISINSDDDITDTVAVVNKNPESVEFMKKKINKGEYLIDKIHNPQGSKSNVWNKFNIIHDVLNKTNLKYVQCSICKQILSYNAKGGTSRLLRHDCQKIIKEDTITATPKVTNFFVKKNQVSVKVTNEIKKDLTECLVDYCAIDLRSFESVAGIGFELVANKFLQIGAKHGAVEANKIIPDPTTVSRHILERKEKLFQTLKPELTEVFENKNCAATTDMWTDDFKKKSYSAFTIHYIINWTLVKRVLFTTV